MNSGRRNLNEIEILIKNVEFYENEAEIGAAGRFTGKKVNLDIII